MKGEDNMGSRLSSSGYVWEQRAAAPFQTVATGADILFSNNGPLNGITHVAGTSQIGITIAGTYNIAFAVYSAGGNPQDWGITVNNEVVARFQANGQNLSANYLLVLAAGDIVTIRSVVSTPNPVPLRQADTISAWVLIALDR